jgi:oligoribonuclease NrnB/cAMP/cGMP phosphodiesterase (DHH superfamily)
MSTTQPLCIYHHACTDGFAAAWAVRYFYLGKVDMHPGIYGEDPPDVTDREVIIVDFSYKRPVMLRLIEQARRVLVIDHHKTAADDLKDLPAKAITVFDMEQSGAMLTWQSFFTGESPPLLFDHIQDRDLWRFKLPMTREIIAAVFSYPMDFATWDQLMQRPLLDLEREGRTLLRKHAADVAALMDHATRWVHFGSVPVPVANVPWMYASDVGGELAKGNPFAGTYYDDEDGRRFSLRSAPDGADVALIAEAFGGGGHKHAAGFRVTREEAAAFDQHDGFQWLTIPAGSAA